MKADEGFIGFAPQAVDDFMNGATSAANCSLKMLLKDNYCRLQFESDVSLDDTSPTAIASLKQEAEQITKTDPYKQLIERVSSILKK
ncbi:MAG: hypothetical protein K2W92_02010 [Alphaproteobacteria bacterium]|nr:hypothetical protein [Alphaproteobacteria bacterium]